MKVASKKAITTVSITVEAAEVLATRAKKAGMSKQQFLSLLLLSPEKTRQEDLTAIDKRIDGLAKLMRAIERDKLDPVLGTLGNMSKAINGISDYCQESTGALKALIRKGLQK